MSTVLLIDDEAKLARLIAETLEADHHTVRTCATGAEGLAALASERFDVVVTDLRMPGADGFVVLGKARALPHPPDVVVMTGHHSAENSVAAMKAGAADYLTKPFALDELAMRVRRLGQARAAAERSARLLEAVTPSLVAQSPAMQATLAAADRVAMTDATVLLTGESGTGKTQLARFIHYASARAGGPLVEVQCAALPEPLLESELFGSVKGAFTGADAAREGHLVRADGGTLFLDEIGEVTPTTQVKLLRFLQDRELAPVGGTVIRKVDARLIAATNRDLKAAVKAGSFREDFFYRLNVFAIEVPPLRARREDVPALVDGFLARKGLPPEKVDAAARRALVEHAWPGNVRELENALERALILVGEQAVTPGVLALKTDLEAARGTADLLVDGFNLDAFERELLLAALQRAGGNKSAAARLLGITRRRLYSRLDALAQKELEGGEGPA